MEPVSSLEIIDSREVPGAKKFTMYMIRITGPVRSWTIEKRYSEMNLLHEQLNKIKPIPYPFPPKIVFLNQKDKENRKSQLESYLNSLLKSKDPIWRRSKLWNDFFDIPDQNTNSSYIRRPSVGLDSSKWLVEYESLIGFVYEIRAQRNERDQLISKGNSTAAQNSSFQMRKGIKLAKEKLDQLDNALDTLRLTPGESNRRKSILKTCSTEIEDLERESVMKVFESSKGIPMATASTDKKLLFDGSAGSFSRRAGIPSQIAETEKTRMLENEQLLDLQNKQMKQQDAIIGVISNVVKRQKEIGIAIGDELDAHVNLLDQVRDKVEVVEENMKSGQKKMNRMIDKS